MSQESHTGPPTIEPTNIRSIMMLDVAREMMLAQDWRQRAVTVSMRDLAEPASREVSFLGQNGLRGLVDVGAGRLDIATLNPMVMLTMATLGTGPFTAPLDLATIAVLPHYDQLAFAVSDRLGFAGLGDIAAAHYPLRVSVRGSVDELTSMSVDVVLGAYGFSLADIVSWGGKVVYDQPMPDHPTRLGRLRDGELDAIFEEGTIIWADKVKAAGATFLPIDDEHLDVLQKLGFRRGVLDAATYPSLGTDVQTLDYSGWPIFCRSNESDDLVRQFCRGLDQAKDRIVWHIGPAHQPPLPLAEMVQESPATPFDVALHPAAATYWREQGYLA